MRVGPNPGRVARALCTALVLAVGACASTPPEDGASAGPAMGTTSLMNLAAATLAGGDVQAALNLYRRAVALDPTATAPRVAIAEAHFVSGALTEARVAYGALAEEAPFESHLGLGRVALASGDPAGAAGHFGRALEREPQSVRALNGLAVTHDLQGDHETAQTIYARALAEDPTNRGIANNLALSEVLSGRFDTGVGRLEELATHATELPQARHNLALAYGLLGNERAARRLIERDLGTTAVDRNLAFYRAARALADISPAAGH